MDEMALFESLRPNESALSDADRVALRASLFAGFEGGDGDGAGLFRDQLPGTTVVTLIDTARTPIQPERRHRWPIIAIAAAAVVVGALVIAMRTDDPIGKVPADHPTTVAPRRATGAFLPRSTPVMYTVPDGWKNAEPWMVIKRDPLIGVMFVDADVAFFTKILCPSGLVDEPVGPTVDDLVSAWAGLPGVTGTEARDVTIDGFDGKQIELTVPVYDDADCDGMFHHCSFGGTRPIRCENLLQTPTWTYDFQTVPNQHRQIWVLDADGKRLIIMAWSFPDISQQDRAALDEIVASIQIG